MLRSHLEMKYWENGDMPTIEKHILSHISKAGKKIMETKEQQFWCQSPGELENRH